jgi:hypothetical protein
MDYLTKPLPLFELRPLQCGLQMAEKPKVGRYEVS